MAGPFIKRFQGRNHVAGQLVTAAELLEMQSMIRNTICGIQADQYGFNPDGSFTPHVVSGFVPTVHAVTRTITISRGHGWVTKSLTDSTRYPIILESDLSVPIPASNATHPKWVHVCLWNYDALTSVSQMDTTDTAVSVMTRDVLGTERLLTADMYTQMVTSDYFIMDGTAAASPVCDIVGVDYLLPIATIYVPAASSGPILAANLHDTRWFTPGHGNINFNGSITAGYVTSRKWGSIQPYDGSGNAVQHGGAGTEYVVSVTRPARDVFPLIPEYTLSLKGSVAGHGTFGVGEFVDVVPRTPYESPLHPKRGYLSSWLPTGAGYDYDAGALFDIDVESTVVI